MNDHNLNDLIIDTIEPKNNKTKSLLTLIALLIIVLIVGIILSKILLKSSENHELSFNENVADTIAPELKLQDTIEPTDTAEESSLSLPMEEKITKANDVEEIAQISSPEIENKENAIIEESKIIDKENEATTLTENKENIEDGILTPVELPIIDKKYPATPKKNIKKIKYTSKKSAPNHKHQAKHINRGYFVQVGSFKKNPSSHFLSLIKKNGFSYHITHPNKSGVKKLLIGPYKTKNNAHRACSTIRTRIHKSAFVVKK